MFVYVFVCVTKHACNALKFRVKKKLCFLFFKSLRNLPPLPKTRLCNNDYSAFFWRFDSVRFVKRTRGLFSRKGTIICIFVSREHGLFNYEFTETYRSWLANPTEIRPQKGNMGR